MEKVLSLLFAFAIYGNVVCAQSFTDFGNVPLGETPPAWLKNKVNEAQYDTLVMMSKRFGMNYYFLKKRNLTPQDVRRYMDGVKRTLDHEKEMKEKYGTAPISFGGVADNPVTIKPLSITKSHEGGVIDAKFVLYSEIDGYDAHVLLTAKFHYWLAGHGMYYTDSFSIEGYSLSSLPVKVEYKLEDQPDHRDVKTISLTTEGYSPVYNIRGTLSYEDAMGNKYNEPFARQFNLEIE